MGTLIAWHYPTNLFLRLADHTYVTCGNGSVRWSCWGGKQGGSALRQGGGSTNRANAIAEPDERAGITCYLINGVCHQAANRILSPAGVTVHGAKGYYVSEALYGTYGRPRGFLGMCKAPFHRHDHVDGDLQACGEGEERVHFEAEEAGAVEKMAALPPDDAGYRRYLERVTGLYAEADMKALTVEPEQSKGFQMRLFEALVDYKLGASFMASKTGSQIMTIRDETETQRTPIESSLEAGEMSASEFLERYNALTVQFQHNLGNLLGADEYQRLLELSPDDTVVLGDPEIIQSAYGE